MSDLVNIILGMGDVARRERQLSLGNLIRLLTPFVEDEWTYVVFEDKTYPIHFGSYRGYYTDLRMSYSEGFTIVGASNRAVSVHSIASCVLTREYQ